MPPKKAPAKKLHELAAEVRAGHKIVDVNRKTYIVGKQFATGGFGRIHTCTEEGKSNEMVIKIEPSTNGPLLTEVVVFNRILKKEITESYKKSKKIEWIGLPHLIANGYFTYGSDKMRYMIIPKYSMSLEAARESNNGKLSVKDSMTVAGCILGSLAYLHDNDYAHADVKAANILLEKPGVYSSAVLVDFGLAHRTTNNVDKPDKKKAHNGTCIFTSTDAHRGNNPSFRGDVEILAYNLVLWISGTLPWMASESSPDIVFEAKQKFIAGLPSTLQNAITNQSSAVIDCITTMFNVSMKTKYTEKCDIGKLQKLVSNTAQNKSAGDEKKTPTKKRKTTGSAQDSATPRKSSRKAKKNNEIKDDEEVVLDDVPKQKSDVKSQKARQSINCRKSQGLRLGLTSSTASTDRVARKIEQKYKRLSMNKSSLVPVPISVTSETPPVCSTPSTSARISSKVENQTEEDTLKTPVLISPVVKKTKYKSGISSATKASPTELRRVPGVRNFPKGRRSILIKETAAEYQRRRVARHRESTSDDPNLSSKV